MTGEGKEQRSKIPKRLVDYKRNTIRKLGYLCLLVRNHLERGFLLLQLRQWRLINIYIYIGNRIPRATTTCRIPLYSNKLVVSRCTRQMEKINRFQTAFVMSAVNYYWCGWPCACQSLSGERFGQEKFVSLTSPVASIDGLKFQPWIYQNVNASQFLKERSVRNHGCLVLDPRPRG